MSSDSAAGGGDYVPRRYEAEVYANAEAQVRTQNPLLALLGSDAERRAATYSNMQARELSAGQDFRPGLSPSDQDYRAQKHEVLYRYATQGGSAGDIDEQGMIANDLGNALKQLAGDFRSASAKEEAEWQGSGAAAAHQFFGGVAEWADGAGDSAHLASNRLSQQSAAVVNAKNTMPEPVPFDQAAEMEHVRQEMASGSITSVARGAQALHEMQTKQEAAQQAHEQAAQVMTTRDYTFHETGSTAPTFAPPPQLGDNSTSASSAGGGAIGMPGGGVPAFGGTGGAPIGGGGPGYTPGASVPGGGTGSAPISGSAPGPGSVNSPNPNYGPPGGSRGAATPPAAFGGSTGPGQLGGERERAPRGRGAGGPRGTFAGGRVSGGGYQPPKGGTVKSPGTGSPVRGGGSAAARLGGGTAGGSGLPGGKGASELGAGRGTGAAGPGARGEGVVRGGTAAAGSSARGGTGMGPMGAGAGKGGKDEDKEKKSPDYLKDANPEDTFGAKPKEGPDGQKPTPPVIGDK